eukprot:355685-Hanusia_phi.AAC.2
MSVAEKNRDKSSLADTYQRETARLQDELKSSKGQLEILSAELRLAKSKYEKSSAKNPPQSQQMNEFERSNAELLRAAGHVDGSLCRLARADTCLSDAGSQRARGLRRANARPRLQEDLLCKPCDSVGTSQDLEEAESVPAAPRGEHCQCTSSIVTNSR